MANATFGAVARNVTSVMKTRLEHVRYGHWLRGKPPTVARTLAERLELLNKTDESTSFKVNIGFLAPKLRTSDKQIWMSKWKKRRSELRSAKPAKDVELSSVDLQETKKIWFKTSSSSDVHRIANHYGIFQDLFGDAFFSPVVPLDIRYKLENDTVVNVYTGNVVKPAEASNLPDIGYEAEENSLWTVVMCTPDGNLENSNNEYCHWFLGNIPKNRVDQGEEMIDYMKPIPAKGVGYHRYIFVLYKQSRRLDYAEYKKARPCLQLQERNWNTSEFYRKYQDFLTPAGLAFFQSDWDPTVTEFYHSALDTGEPIFQYAFSEPYIKPQTWFPLKQAFNLYLDRYRDPKEITKEYFLRRIRNVHPFEEPSPPLKYPNACRIDHDVPSWLKEEMKKERMGWGRVNDTKRSVRR